jgi:hypothetical protein
MDQEPDNNSEAESLETREQTESSTTGNLERPSAEPIESSQNDEANQSGQIKPPEEKLSEPSAEEAVKKGVMIKLLQKAKATNLYLLIFILLIMTAGFITYVAYQKSQQGSGGSGPGNLTSQSINDDVLKQLKNTDVTVGQPKQILSVEANAIFAGTVLIRGDFESAGQIKSEGPVTAPEINISGSGTFQTLQANKLQLAGDGQVQGNLSVQNSLSVSGSGNFGGTLSANKISIQSLELAGDLLISKHIKTSGAGPSKNNGAALGGGGTSSLSGSDTAGTININTGSSPHPGCFVTVNFTRKFSSPHVVVTPVGSIGASINYYVIRSSGSFSLCTVSSAPAGKSFSFDYIVID